MNEQMNGVSLNNINKDVQRKCEMINNELNKLIEFYYTKYKENIYFESQNSDSGKIKKLEERTKEFSSSAFNEKYKKDDNTQTFINLKKTEYHNDITFLKGVIESWDSLSRKVFDISEKIQDIKKSNVENINFNTYEEFKVHITKLIETVVFSRSELEDIKKQLIFDDNANKNSKYFASKITNNKQLKEFKYSLESKYLRLSENLLNDIFIVEKDIPEHINFYRKFLKENEWNNDLKESFRYTIQIEEKLEKQLKDGVNLDNLQEIEQDYKSIANKCKYIDVLIQSDNEGVYKKRFNSDINQMNTLLRNIKERINNLKEVSHEFKLYHDSYLEHIELLKSKNNKLYDLFKNSLKYIEDLVDATKQLKNINNSLNNFQKETYLKCNLYNQEFQQDVVLLNQWGEYYRDINQHFERENLKVEHKNIVEWKENIESNRKKYQNNIKNLEYLNAYLMNITNLFKQKIKNNDYISIYVTQLKRCEEFQKILNSDGIDSSYILTNITKCEKRIDKVFSAIERKYNDITNEASNLYEQFINFSNNENINILGFCSDKYRDNAEKVFFNDEIKTMENLLKIRRLQFEKIFSKLKFYNTQINKKSNDITCKFDYIFSNEDKIFLKTINESKKINKEKEKYQVYHQKINTKYNELKVDLSEINKKIKNELDEEWKNCCDDSNILISDLKTMPKDIKHWCYLNIPKSNDLEEMELCMKIENEFNNFINIFIEKWNILVGYKGKIDKYEDDNKWKKLNENEINDLKDVCNEISNIEITFKRLSEILTTSYASIGDKNISAIIDVQDTMVEKFENFKKNILIVINKYIKVSSVNIKNEATENFLKNSLDWCQNKLVEINDFKYSIRTIDLYPIYEMYNCNFDSDSGKFEDYDVSLNCLISFFTSNDDKILKEQNISFNDNYEIISDKKLEFEKYFSTLLINDFCIEKKQTVLEKFNKLKEELQEWKIIISDFEMACDCKEYMLNMLFFINLTDKKLDTLHDLLENAFKDYESFHRAELDLMKIKNKIHQFNFEVKRNTLEHSKLINFKNKELIYKDLNLLYRNITDNYNNLKLYLDKIDSDYKKVSIYYESGKNIISVINDIKERRKLILNDDTLLCFDNNISKQNQNQCKNDIDKCLSMYNEMLYKGTDKKFLNNHGISKYMEIVKKEINNTELYIKDSFTKENVLKLINECDLISHNIEENVQKLDKDYEQGYIFDVYTEEIEDLYNNINKISNENYSYINQYNKNKYRIKDIINKNNNLLNYDNIKKFDEMISKSDIPYNSYKENSNKKINKFKDYINDLKNSKEKLVRINKKINEIYNILSRIEEDPKCAIEQHNGKLNLIKLIDDNCQTLKKIFQSDIYKKYENSMYFHHYPIDLLEKFSNIKKLIIYYQMNDKKEDAKNSSYNNLSIEMEKHKEEIDIIIETTVEEYKELLGKQEVPKNIFERFSEVNDIFKNVIKQLQLEWIDLKDNYIDYVSKKNVKLNKDNGEYSANVNHCEYLCNKIEKNYQEINSILNFINHYEEILSEIFNLRKTKESLLDDFRTCLSVFKSLEGLMNDKECSYPDIKECSKNSFKVWREEIRNYKKKSSKLINFIQCDIEDQTKFDEFVDVIREKIQIDVLINNYDKRLSQISELFDSINKYYDKYQISINSLVYILEHHISKENISNWKLFTINDKINYDVLQEIIDDHSLYESQYKKICDDHERKNNKYLKKIISCIMNKKELTECGDPMNVIPLYIKEKLLDFFTSNSNIWSLKYLHKLWEIENDIYQIILNYKQLFKNLENVKEDIDTKLLSVSQFEKNHNDKLLQYQTNINKVKEKYESIKEAPAKEILRIIELLDEKSQDMIHDSEVEIKKVIEETNMINTSMDKLNDDINVWCDNTEKNLDSITKDFFPHVIKIPINELASIKFSSSNNDYNDVKSFINLCEEDILKYTMKEIKGKKYEVDEIDFVLNHKKMVINNKINKYDGNIEFQKALDQLMNKRDEIEKLEENVISFNNKYFFTMKMLKTYRNAINLLFSIQYSENIIKFCNDIINNNIENINDNKLEEKIILIKNGLFGSEFENKMNELKKTVNELNETQGNQEKSENCDFYNKIKNLKNIQKELNSNVKSIQRELSFSGESNENKQLYLSKFNEIVLYLDNYYNEVNENLKETEKFINECICNYKKYNDIVKPFVEKFDQEVTNIENEELKYNINFDEKKYINKIKNRLVIIRNLYYSENVTDILVNINNYKPICKTSKSINNIVSKISKKFNDYYEFIHAVENYIKYFDNNIYIPKNIRNVYKNNLNNKKQIDVLKEYLNINILENSRNVKEREIKDNIVDKIANTFKVNETLLETTELDINKFIQSSNKFISEYQKVINSDFRIINNEIEKDKNEWEKMNNEYKVNTFISLQLNIYF